MPQTKFAGGIPATIAFKLSNEDEWIVGVVLCSPCYLDMVKLRVTGADSYEWIDTKYTKNYDASCLTSFSEACFVGTTADRNYFRINLVAEWGKQYKSIFLNV